MIETFRVQNYKALRDVELKLTPMHVLIGPNDSGKTSILEALGALCRSVDFDLNTAFETEWRNAELVWRGADEPIFLRASLRVFGNNVLSYLLGCRFSKSGGKTAALSNEAIGQPGQGHLTLIGNPDNFINQSNVFRLRDQTSRDLASKVGAVGTVHEFLTGVDYYRWDSRFLALANAEGASQRFRIASSGLGLALCLDDILGSDHALFGRIEARLREFFPDIESITLIREVGYYLESMKHIGGIPVLREGRGKGLHFKLSSGVVVPAAQMSDGVLLVLAYLAVLCSPAKPRVLLIEEPENGIHPKRLKEVLQILRGLVSEQSYTQVLMTTHSPYVLDEFKAEEVTLCQKGQDGAIRVRRLSEVKAVREQLDVFSLGEIWTAEGDEALARGDSNGVGGKQ